MPSANIEVNDGPFGEDNYSAKIEVNTNNPDVGPHGTLTMEVLNYKARKIGEGGWVDVDADEVRALLDAFAPMFDSESVAAVREIVAGYDE